MLPNGASIPCADVSIDDVTNSVYVRLLADRELTMIGKYGIMFNLKLANGVMYSSPMVVFAEVSADAEVEYKELNISLGVALTYLPANVAYTGASPKIGPNGTWLVYNDELNAYEDTGEPANYGGLLGEVQSLKDIIETSLTPHFITNAVKVDWKTIGKNADGELCYIGAGIGDNEGNIDIAILDGYLTDRGYAKHIDIAKEYATKEWVEKKKFITIDSLPQKISAFANDKGYITIDALAPYATLATTLGGYGITNAYTKTETDARIFGEVKRLFEDPRFVTAAVNIDGRTIKRDGNGALYVDETALKINGGVGGVADSVYWNNVIGKPSWIDSTKPTYKYSEIEERPDLSVYALKTAIPTKLSQLTDDVVSGKYLPITGGTINGNITANNIVASSVLGVNNINGKYSFMVVPSGDNTYIEAAKTDGTSNKGNIIFSGLNAENLNSLKILSDSVTSNGNITAPKFIGNLTGNADSATKLAKKVSLWGQEFDGTKDITGAMTVDGDATFSRKVVIGGISLRKVDNYLFIDSPLVLSGGVTMYGDDGTTVKPIWESIPLDESTLAWINGELSVVGGVGSGGGISEEFLNATLQGYQPKITSSNKLAYSLISGTPDLSAYFLASNFTKSNIKSTLGISDWALESVKPPYTASEVGALKLNRATTNADLDTILPSGEAELKPFFQRLTTNDVGSARKGVLRISYNDSESQLLFDHYHRILRYRTIGSNPKDWSTFAFTSDIPTKLSQLTDDVVAGNYLSTKGGTINGSLTATSFIGNLTGTADNANSLGGESYLSFARYTAGAGYIGFYIPNTSIHNLGQGDGYIEYYDGGWYNAKWGKVTALNGFVGNLTGNADSATKLATARTIWGQSFDGTGNITGDIAFGDNKKISWHNQPSYYYINSPATSDGAYLQYMAYSGHRFLGGNVAIGDTYAYAKLHVHGDAIIQTLHFITNEINGVNGTGNVHINYSSTGKVTIANGGGNVAIGGTAAEAKLHVHGTAKFTDDTTFSKKVVIGTIPVYQSADGTLFVDANVVFRGGVAMYGNTTTTVNEE